jgi:sugar phosphate isomerase/epimerase
MISPRLSVSTWSLHKKLGLFYEGAPDGKARTSKPTWGEGEISLLDVPAQAAAHGIGNLEICHFHFPSTDPDYLAELKGALKDAGVKLLSVLVDEGDITNADQARRERDFATISGWIDVAGQVGAERARVIAGDAKPDPEGHALHLSASALHQLAIQAEDWGVRLTTENWHDLLPTPKELISLLNMLEGRLGLCFDFGNWGGEDKYEKLTKIAPYAETTHAKAQFPEPGKMNREDYTRCLDILAGVGFTGPHSLIFDTAGDEWAGIDEEKSVVLPYIN